MTKDAFSTNGLHIIGADSYNDRRLRWATWGKRSKHGVSIVLVLLGNTQNGSLVLWSREYRDSYEPHITRLTSWRYGQHPILALTYRYGALAEQVVLYGIDINNRPIKLDEKLGEEIDWGINSKGEGLMIVFFKPDDHMVKHCYRWGKQSQRLEEAECE